MRKRLDLDALQQALGGTIFHNKLHLFPSIESTNTHAMQEAAKGAPHGSVYVAEEQTAGRGRGDHAWHSEPYTGIYMSILLRPHLAAVDGLWLSLATGLAVQRAIESVTELVTDIRWPNDLLSNGRKVGGILVEMNAEASRIRYTVIGIGINVNQVKFPAELSSQATSLRLETDREIAREDLLADILEYLWGEIDALIRPDNFAVASAEILKRLETKSTWILGKRVFVDEAGGYTGVTAGLDEKGFLWVQTDDGMRRVLSGGVRERFAKG
ncbi:MAG TPA: biotin--[acetyl-CoA-carboxylase] ligase [Acidobacteriaceae bacterium]|nr:biotin--[acetyl-CoA-carboxylase] ligase [Acidobacteriaceae bacterium]